MGLSTLLGVEQTPEVVRQHFVVVEGSWRVEFGLMKVPVDWLETLDSIVGPSVLLVGEVLAQYRIVEVEESG